jgi:transcriptional regulator with XRE-family HTH domain
LKFGNNWFGECLKLHRERAHITQMKLAEAMDVVVQTIREWESGAKHPQLRRLPRLAEVLGVSLSNFFPPDVVYPSDWPDAAHDNDSPVQRLDKLEAQMASNLNELREIKRGMSQET